MQQFKVCIELEAPLLSSGTVNLPLGVDAQQLQYQKQPVVPGSLIRGLLRHAWTDLNNLDQTLHWPVEQWLGGEGTDNRGQLFFSPFFKASAQHGRASGGQNLIRIAINENTGTAESKMLKIINTCWPVGTKLKLEGVISYSATRDQNKHLATAIAKGLQWAGAIGAERGVGFGHIESVDVQPVEQNPNETSRASLEPATADRLRVSLKFDGPVCFAKPHNTERANRFDSHDFMPGAALLAVLVRCGVSGEVVDRIHASHLKPETAPPLVPMSWVCGGGVFFNAADTSGPFMVQGPEGDSHVPTFPVDWKGAEFDAAIRQLSSGAHQAPKPWLEVRTAIQAGGNRPEKSKLFSLNCLQTLPADPWTGVMDISALTEKEKQQVFNALDTSTLGPFGKTDALAGVDICVAENTQTVQKSDRYCLMLSADAALVDCSSRGEARTGYENYWKSVFAQLPIELEDCYLDEYFGGGEYLYKQFGFSGKHYTPQIVARAGSVFVLRCTDDNRVMEFAAVVDKFIANGLPEPNHFRTGWQHKPWAHANGYGRVQLCPEPTSVEGWNIRPLTHTGVAS